MIFVIFILQDFSNMLYCFLFFKLYFLFTPTFIIEPFLFIVNLVDRICKELSVSKVAGVGDNEIAVSLNKNSL